MNWGTLFSAGLSIAEIAKDIYSNFAKKKNEANQSKAEESTLSALEKRITSLENNELRQSELILQMANQIKTLTGKLRTAYHLYLCLPVLFGM